MKELKDRHNIAWKYFIATGEIPADYKPYEYSLHHINPSWLYYDKERYDAWNPEDLVVLTSSEHAYIHNNNIAQRDDYMQELLANKKPFDKALYDELCIRHSNAKGKHWNVSEETKLNMSIAAKATYANGRQGSALGKHWYNNGINETYAIECPDGYVRGRLPKAMDAANHTRLKRYAELNQIKD